MADEQIKEQDEESKAKNKKNTLIGCGVVIAIVIILAAVMGTCLGGTTTETTPSATVGSEAFIRAPELDTVYLAVNKESFDMWTKACVAKDYIGMSQLQTSGRVFAVPNGTKVLVIDSSFAARKVRILEGGAFGKSGWLPYEWVK